MSGLLGRPRLLLVAVFLLGALVAGSGVVVAATVVRSGRAVTAVKVVTETKAVELGRAGTWYDIPGMSLDVRVPRSQTALLLITFSAEVYCNNNQSTKCAIRVLVDGNTAAAPGALSFDSAADGPVDSSEANSMQFVSSPLNEGSHTVKVQWNSNNQAGFGGAVMQRTLSVLRVQV